MVLVHEAPAVGLEGSRDAGEPGQHHALPHDLIVYSVSAAAAAGTGVKCGWEKGKGGEGGYWSGRRD